VRTLRGNIASLLCIFPFEEAFFRQHGVNAHYIGHPLTRIVRARWSRGEFFARHGLDAAVPMVVLLPGSRTGERARHLPVVLEAVDRLVSGRRLQFVLAVPEGTRSLFLERFAGRCIETIQGDTWDAIAHAELALAASGTVTVEAALLGTPMVTYYRVNRLSWLLGRPLVDVPYYTMVNLVAGRRVVPELIQNEMTAERIASEAARLLDDPRVAAKMRTELGEVARLLATGSDPMEMAADLVIQALSGRPDKEHAHVAS
jgi:lipid-A-disaccharide synthase